MADHNINIKIGAKNTTKGAFGRVTAGLKRIGAAIATYLSARAVTSFVKSSIESFMRQEDALNSLSAALSKNGEDVSALMPKYQKFAAAIQTVTKYGDEGTLEIMAYGRNLGITTDKLEDATRAAVGLAAKFKLDLRTSMMLVGRASQGQTQMLTRYGITLDDTLTDQEKFNTLLKIGGSNFRLAAEEANTLRGRVEQAKNAFGDMKENIGAAIVDGFNLSQMFDNLSLSIQASNQAGDFTNMINDLKILKDALKPVATFFLSIKDAAKGIGGGLFAGAEVVKGNVESLKQGDVKGFFTSGEELKQIAEAWQAAFLESATRRVTKAQTVNQLRGERAGVLAELSGEKPVEVIIKNPNDLTAK